MALRAPVTHTIRRKAGPIAANAWAFVYLRGTATQVALYPDDTSTVPITQPLRPDQTGRLRAYAPLGSRLDIFVTDGFSSYTQPWEPFDGGLEPWNDATLLNGASNFGSGYAPAQYCKTSEGLVLLRGTIGSGFSTQVFDLPVGYRPSLQILTYSWQFNGGAHIAGRIDVQTNGQVHIQTGSTLAAFDNVRFMTGV
jgi:hypothetical protein